MLQAQRQHSQGLPVDVLAVMVALVGGAVLLVLGVGFRLDADWAFPLAALAALPLLVPLRGYWVPPVRQLGRALVGPVLFYDLVRSARRGRYVLLRCLYGLALLLMLFLFYAKWAGSIWDVWSVSTIDRTQAARFAEEFFYVFISVQFLAVLVLTPAFAAGAIAEEKERKTFEFLLTTELGNGEIVLGKLLSRLAFMTLLVLTGLPVLSLLQFLGGVDPGLVLAGFAATAATMLSLAGLGVFNSVYARKPLTAIFLTYLEAAVYLIGSALLKAATGDIRSRDLRELVDLVHCGNPVLVVQDLFLAARGSGSMTAHLPILTASYVSFHGLVALVTVIAATGPLRVWSKWQLSSRSRRAFVLGLGRRRLPRVTDQPMLWKELHAEPIFRFNRWGMILTSTFVIMALLFGAFVMICLFSLGQMLDTIQESMNRGARVLGTFFACMLLLGVAVRAAGTLSSERDRQTLDSLLSSPLSNDDILWSKWLASILSGRKIWWYLAAIWLSAALTTGLHPLALPLLAVAWTVYAVFLASVGLWFSLTSRNTLRATIWTVLVAAATCVIPWLLALFSQRFGSLFAPDPKMVVSPYLSQMLSVLAPPSTLNFLSFCQTDLGPPPTPYETVDFGGSGTIVYATTFWDRLLAVLLGLMCYALAAALLWTLTRACFPSRTGRMPTTLKG